MFRSHGRYARLRTTALIDALSAYTDAAQVTAPRQGRRVAFIGSSPEVSGRLAGALKPQVFFNYFGPDNAKELTQLKKLQNFGGYMLDRTDERMCPITLGGYIIEDKLLIKWEYNLNLHNRETLQPAAQRCGEVLRWFIEDCRNRKA